MVLPTLLLLLPLLLLAPLTVEVALIAGLLLFLMKLVAAAGLAADVGGELCGVILGLSDSPLIDVLTASIGRKHCASGLNVLVTSRSAFLVSSKR